MRKTRWIVGGLTVLCSALAMGQGCQGTAGILPPAGQESETHRLFTQVWTDFSENYSHFAAKNVDWDSVKEAYEPLFEEELSTADFLSETASMLAELQDLHVALFDPNGQPVEVYSRPGRRNFTQELPAVYFPDGLQQLKSYPLWHGWLGGNIAYMSVESFSGWDGLRTGELDDLLATYAAAVGFIVDARRNNGGAEVVAQAIAGHFTAKSFAYGFTEDRIPGPDRNAYKAPVPHVVDPADNAPFLKPAVLLMGNVNLSSAEWFVLMMANCDNVRTVGDVTRGSSGNPQQFSLSNGISYLIPSWVAFTAEMTPIEDVGIEPQIYIAADESYDDSTGVDFVLERAMTLLSTGQ